MYMFVYFWMSIVPTHVHVCVAYTYTHTGTLITDLWRLGSDEALPVGHHLNEKFECTLKREGTVVGNVSEDEQGIDTNDVVPPCGKVSDDACKWYHGCSDDLVVHVYGEPGQQVKQVLLGHALGKDPWDGCDTGAKEVKLGLHSTRDGGESERRRE